jgi:Na+-transporting methylmalonyl-CoA/oxaloacetate decarboxylase gamma subunit
MGLSISSIFASVSASPDLGDVIRDLLVGFSIVMLTLLALAVVCTVIGALFKAFPGLAAAGMVAAPEKGTPSRAQSGVDEKVVAVIGAAVDQALGGRYRIKSVTPLEKK